MNARGIPPPDGAVCRAAEPREQRTDAPRRPAPPGRRAVFEQLLRHGMEQAVAEPAADGLPAMDGATLCGVGAGAGGPDPLLPPPQPLFGATLGAAPAAGRRSSGGLSLGLAAAAGRGARTPRHPVYDDPLHALADDSTPESRAAAWELVQELTQCLHVAEQRQAQHGTVHLELKGQLLAGTQVSFVRRGQQLRVEIAPGCEQAQRLVSRQLEVLRELLAGAAPDCDVSLLLAGSP